MKMHQEMHELRLRAGAWPPGTRVAIGRRDRKWWLGIEVTLAESRNLPLRRARYGSLQDLSWALYRDDPADPLCVLPNSLIWELCCEAGVVPAKRGPAGYAVPPANREDFGEALVGWSKARQTFWAELYQAPCNTGPAYTFPDPHFREERVADLAQFLYRTQISAVISDSVTAALAADQRI